MRESTRVSGMEWVSLGSAGWALVDLGLAGWALMDFGSGFVLALELVLALVVLLA